MNASRNTCQEYRHRDGGWGRGGGGGVILEASCGGGRSWPRFLSETLLCCCFVSCLVLHAPLRVLKEQGYESVAKLQGFRGKGRDGK